MLGLMLTPVGGEVIGLMRQLVSSVRQKGEAAVEVIRKSSRRLGEGTANLGSSRRLGSPRTAGLGGAAGGEGVAAAAELEVEMAVPPLPSKELELIEAEGDAARRSTLI